MSLEEILHTLSSPPSKKLKSIGKPHLSEGSFLLIATLPYKLRRFLEGLGHYKIDSRERISEEACYILTNRKNIKILEAYLNF